MRTYRYATVDVFTTRRFGGNPLAIFPDATGLSDVEMQALAAEMNLSETSFVLSPTRRENDAVVRIFNRTSEMPFAGHPNVGTAYLLSSMQIAERDALRFEELAGLVTVQIDRDQAGTVIGATVEAPQSLCVADEIDPTDIGRCLGLEPDQLRLDSHPPLFASVGAEFAVVEVSLEALGQAQPNLAAFRQTAEDCHGGSARLAILLYAWVGTNIRARMFAPLSGTWEDPATGSANAALAALLLSLGSDESQEFRVDQGLEMGRPSELRLRAWRSGSAIRASVGGMCVPVFRGEVSL